MKAQQRFSQFQRKCNQFCIHYLYIYYKLNSGSQAQMLTPESKYFSGRLKIKNMTLGSTTQINNNGISISCRLHTKDLSHTPIRLYPKNIQYDANAVILSEFVSDLKYLQENQHVNQQFGIMVTGDAKKVNKSTMLSKYYRCLYIKNEGKLKLTTFPSKKLYLNLHLVENPRFAKTQKLESILNGQFPQEKIGITTMDQIGRILIQSNECKFPAVGLWLKCDNLYSPMVYVNIFAFLKRKPTKMFTKLLSTLDNESYIYFVKLKQNQIPELYLVNWVYEESLTSQSEVGTQYEVKEGRSINLEFNQSHLEFTLRGEASNQKQLDFASPKKQMTNKDLQDQLQRLHLQESPQFSSIKKYENQFDWQEERTQLKMKVQTQQQQIETLKKEVQRLKKQLGRYQNVNSPPGKQFGFFKSPALKFNSQTPVDKGKKLSSSDLESSNMRIFESGSTKQKNSISTGSNSNSGFGQPDRKVEEINKIIEGGQQPWDVFEIIQDTD